MYPDSRGRRRTEHFAHDAIGSGKHRDRLQYCFYLLVYIITLVLHTRGGSALWWIRTLVDPHFGGSALWWIRTLVDPHFGGSAL